jgi:arylformamidase
MHAEKTVVSKPAAPWRIKGKRVYRSFSQRELETEYDVEAAVGSEEHLACRAAAMADSLRVRDARGATTDVPYGPTGGQRLDVFAAPAPASPVAVYIHGGYWKSGSKESCLLFAETFAGAAYVSVEYDRAPDVSVAEIVRQCRAAVAWVHEHAAEFNGDPANIHVLGHSVGGQLTAMVAATDWQGEYGIAVDPVRSIAVTSGVYDLEPVRLSFANAWARLDREAATAASPLFNLPARPRPAVVGWGADETAEFRRQSQDFAVALQARGWPCRTFAVEGRHHFNVARTLADADHPMTRAVLDNMGL